MDISIQTGSIVNQYGVEKGYRMIAEAGFTAVDWNIDVELTGAKLSKATTLSDLCIFEKPLEEMLKYFEPHLVEIEKNNLRITQAHAPFPAYIVGRPETLDYCIGVYKNVIKLCDAVGCKNLVIHGITASPAEPDKTYEDFRQMNFYLYESLIDTLLETNVTVCLENLFFMLLGKAHEGTCADPHEAVDYIDTLNAKAGRDVFGFCLDTGHLNLLGKRFSYYLPILGKRITALHIHDNDGLLDRHMAPYTGLINWKEFISTMRDIGYDHDLNFETFRQTDKNTIGEELLPEFLRHIYAIGDYFKKSISQ